VSLPTQLQCFRACGGVMKMTGRYQRNLDFGVYRCGKCGRETIETAQPMPTDSTGQDMRSKYRPEGEAA